MSEHKATITIEVVDVEEGTLSTTVTLDGEINLKGASFAIANLRAVIAREMCIPVDILDAGIGAAKRTIEQEIPKSARDKLYELLEALHEQKEERKDGNEA